jgi:signal transduction histidine kinase/ActR/RegA family two-component response regulator
MSEILSRAARRSSGLLLVFSPAVMLVSVLIGIATAKRALVQAAITEVGLLAAFGLAHSALGRRRPELPLFLGASVMIWSLLLSAWQNPEQVNAFGYLAPVVPLTLAAFAPLPPHWFLLLGAQAAVAHPVVFSLVPSPGALDPWLCAALSLALATMAGSAARGQRAVWSALTSASDQALDAARLKSEFLANMSHEIRTPMTAILGFADELEREIAERGPEDPARVSLRTIQRNGEHLLALINGILDLSKIEAGKFSIERSRVSVLETVSQVLQLLGAHAREKGLTLEAECDGPVPVQIQSDAVRLRQILINLIGNAIKFTPSGRVRLRLRLAAPRSDAGHLLEIAVEDTGIGLDPRQQAIVFEPFTQVQSSAAREFGGTGLGLSLSRRLARLLGGDIDVTSAPGRGSCFTLRVATGSLERVPMVTGGVISALEPIVVSVPEKSDASLRGRVLVAEDGADNQRLLRSVLTRAGLEVEIAENGEIASELALAALELGAPYDVILMDMQMPVLDGYTATQRLRAQGYAGPIIALTAHAMAGDREKCLLAGCDDYATKPIARRKLLEQIATLLAKKRA